MWTTRAILRDISDVLMERVPRGLCIKTIGDELGAVSCSHRVGGREGGGREEGGGGPAGGGRLCALCGFSSLLSPPRSHLPGLMAPGQGRP